MGRADKISRINPRLKSGYPVKNWLFSANRIEKSDFHPESGSNERTGAEKHF
jgi:hypothetical protein